MKLKDFLFSLVAAVLIVSITYTGYLINQDYTAEKEARGEVVSEVISAVYRKEATTEVKTDVLKSLIFGISIVESEYKPEEYRALITITYEDGSTESREEIITREVYIDEGGI